MAHFEAPPASPRLSSSALVTGGLDAPATPSSVIANQVFVGCPWRNVRPKYEAAIAKLERRFPLHLVIVGRDESQDAEELFAVIQQKLLFSSDAIFDVTGGNPNVSLEFGIAEAAAPRRRRGSPRLVAGPGDRGRPGWPPPGDTCSRGRRPSRRTRTQPVPSC